MVENSAVDWFNLLDFKEDGDGDEDSTESFRRAIKKVKAMEGGGCTFLKAYMKFVQRKS
ncbi:hypothetical protein [Listeria rocourtiae]|uniref:hypothetical protein n=1 Tax=Listeria rocourtiae TaxID=647910 RepID=UPI003D2F668C